MERLEAQRVEFAKLLGAGAIDADTFARAMKGALDTAISGIQMTLPLAIDPGEFRALAAGITVEGLTIGTQDRIENQQLTELRRQSDELAEINANTRDGNLN